MPDGEATALNNACAAFTGNLQCLHGSGNQSLQVINGEGHNTRFFFGSSSQRQLGLLSKTHTPATRRTKGTGTRFLHRRHEVAVPAQGQHPGGSWVGACARWEQGGPGSVPAPGLAPAFLLVLG